MGEHRVVFVYALLAIVYVPIYFRLHCQCRWYWSAYHESLEVTIWVVPSIIENGVAVNLRLFVSQKFLVDSCDIQVSFIGLLLGPLFPLLISHTAKVIPRRILTGALGWISGIGMAGSAALPFATGLLAARYGISSLQPLYVDVTTFGGRLLTISNLGLCQWWWSWSFYGPSFQ